MSNKYSNGRILLKDLTGGSWYYVDVNVFEGAAQLNISQVPATAPAASFSEYAVLKSDTGEYFKIQLQLFEGVVSINITQLATPEPPARIMLLGDNNIYYEILVTSFEDQTFLEISLPSANQGTLSWPYKIVIPANFVEEREIVVPILR